MERDILISLIPVPVTGVTSQKNVTVIAKDGTTADWLSTACSILSVRKAKRLAKKMKAGLIIAQMKNNRIEYYTSKNIKSYYLLQQ
jgi:thiamine biosynthesis lipoprotein